MPQAPENLREFDSFVRVVELLRGPDGCPWDKEQTHQSLTRNLLEECFELAEALDAQDIEHIKEELGDVLLQVVLHSQIARESEHFNIKDVIETISSKMIRRHPHVFSDVEVSDSDEVLENWAKIKAEEKKSQPKSNSPFDIPVHLPALLRSQKIGSKTKKYNFDWNQPEQVLEKIEEELAEVKEAIAQKSIEEQSKEVGDLLFSVAQLARHLKIDAEQSLRQTNQRFESRFRKMQYLAKQEDKDFSDLSSEELEAYWQQAKRSE